MLVPQEMKKQLPGTNTAMSWQHHTTAGTEAALIKQNHFDVHLLAGSITVLSWVLYLSLFFSLNPTHIHYLYYDLYPDGSKIFICSLNLHLQNQTQRRRYLRDTSAWVTHINFKFNMSKTEFILLQPKFVSTPIFDNLVKASHLPSGQAKNKSKL